MTPPAPPLRDLLLSLFRHIWWPALLFPVLAVGASIGVLLGSFWLTPLWPNKAGAELAALAFTPLIPLTAGVRYALHRRPFLLWLAVLGALIVWREIHLDFAGADTLTLSAVVGMGVLVCRRYAWFEQELRSRVTVTLLATAAWTYALTQFLDSGALAWVPGEDLFETRTGETVELLGHALVLAAVVSVRRAASPRTITE